MIRWSAPPIDYNHDTQKCIRMQYFFSGTAFEQASLLDSGDPEGIVPHGSTYLKAFGLGSHVSPIISHIAKHIPGYSRILKFENFAHRAARRRLQNGPSFQDGISYLLDNDEGKPTIKVDDLPFESATILLGGAETTGATCILLVYFLMTHPKWYGLLSTELNEFFQDKDFNAQLLCVCQHPCPPPPRVVPPGGMEVNNRFVPGGTSVGVPVWTHHMDQEYFPLPNVFDPGRWIENSEFKGRDILFAFTAGPFNCAGSKLVYAQLRIFAAMLVTQLQFTPTAAFNAEKFWDAIRNFRATTFLEPLLVSVVPKDGHELEL
ncbi:Cytochrome P450 monooxygenase 23 [Mycena venus]|uniref:Cytochrome P450 monooxygenase 23 n=1 Tax=Mycena venus TaxID=2733690 RepID=A0A8H6XSG8_9AGAR|nr:Cytochrome P450 monooxygenase 23 [Mycena venus]